MILVVCRYIPGARTAITLTAGAVRYELRKFSFFDAIAALSWGTYSTMVGYIGGEAFVFLVAPGNKVERRKVVAERTFGTNWVVSGGLQPGDKVITQGTSNLRSGASIKPVPANARQRVEPRQAGAGGGRGRQGG